MKQQFKRFRPRSMSSVTQSRVRCMPSSVQANVHCLRPMMMMPARAQRSNVGLLSGFADRRADDIINAPTIPLQKLKPLTMRPSSGRTAGRLKTVQTLPQPLRTSSYRTLAMQHPTTRPRLSAQVVTNRPPGAIRPSQRRIEHFTIPPTPLAMRRSRVTHGDCYPYLGLPTRPLRRTPRVPHRSPLPPEKPKRRIPPWFSAIIALLVIFFVCSGGLFAYYQTEIAPSLRSILGNKALRNNASDEHAIGLNERVNIVLLGSDTDGKNNDPERGGAPLAQTVMIVTIDPRTHYVGMLSLPRDLQVTDSRYAHPAPKLDEVFMHAFEENEGKSVADRTSRAAGHTMDVIEANYGIHIDHYAWVGLKGFIKVIDTAGGIDVDVIHPMVDDTYPDDINNTQGSIYDYKRLHIAPGPQHLNGVQALEYVRTRHSDLLGDFGRTIRQQQILSQLKQKLTTNEIISKAPQYLRDLTGSLYTDMNLADIITLGNYARHIDLNKVERVTMGPPLYAQEGNGRAGNFLPICGQIKKLITKMFQTTPRCLEQTNYSEPSPTPTTTIKQSTPTPVPAKATPTQKVEPSPTLPSPTPTPSFDPTPTTETETEPSDATKTLEGLLRLLLATTVGAFGAL